MLVTPPPPYHICLNGTALMMVFCLVSPDILEKLLEWTLEGLDLGKAVGQPETAHKVRHLKMGIKLAGSMCTCSRDILLRCLVSWISRVAWLLLKTMFAHFYQP